MTWRLEAEHAMGSRRIRRYRWPSGLRALIWADRSAPIVSYQTWLDVGSARERPGKTGMAHFFEHLMFSGTAAHPAGEFDRLIEETGGDSNAATWVDWTFYRDTVPARDLPLVVGLEADRLHRLALSDDDVEAERGVIVSERLEHVDNDVDGFLDEQLFSTAFTAHPYRWPVIGWMRDIRALTPDDLRSFYRSHYSPANAVIAVVGDVDESAALALIADAYGGLPTPASPASPAAPDLAPAAAPAEPAQTGERRARFAKPVAADRVLIGYRIPGMGDPDWLVLDLIASLLAGGPSSRLQRRLVIEAEAATAVSAGAVQCRDPSLLRVAVAATRGHAADEVVAAVDRAIDDLVHVRISDAELDRAKACAETDLWAEMETVDGKGEMLGMFECTLGDFRALFSAAERLRAITPADIARVAARYLVSEQRTVVVAEPEAAGPRRPRRPRAGSEAPA